MIHINKFKYNIYHYLRYLHYNYPVYRKVILKLLLDSQYWSQEKIINFQLFNLNKLLLTAKNSFYYKRKLNDLDLPLQSIEEFCLNVPFISKETIKKNSIQLKTENFCNHFKHTTSGSTGEPITIYTSGMAEVYREAGFLRFFNWWKINPYDKSILIWGKKDTDKHNNSFIDKLKNGPKNRYDINIFDLNNKTIFKYYNDIKEIKPTFIRGYKSAILQFAELLEEKSLSFDTFKFRVAIVTSEVLRDEERCYIEKILDCKVANEYGAAESGQIAFECPNGSIHIFEEAVYLSVDKNNNVILTELHNDSMPLINYKNDDKVILSDNKCSCGRNLRIISKIEGRVDDYIIKPNGERISQYLFYYIIKELDDIGFNNCIYKYRVIQEKNKFQFLVLPTGKYNNEVERYIKRRVYEEIGKQITIEYNLVDSIPRDKSGKLRFFSRVE